MHVSQPELKPGRYRHYKGNDYQVIDVARHSEDESLLVVYRPLYGEGKLWVRPLEMFTETVEVNGESVPRFAFISEE
ncbi:DUF1653 domain-containing protein [Neptunicella marina]|uniref:DUF1653 domain-containing protein n=1 Tax=Neptunicella marina TaxID=2125989 RepID=A0A8J6M3D8_9ALTE|nr:DUF1653 domain-containing protein [Neptunicella marina]MBC3766897.1 DUF1653 domain-containing protein [Neptunicella marina]